MYVGGGGGVCIMCEWGVGRMHHVYVYHVCIHHMCMLSCIDHSMGQNTLAAKITAVNMLRNHGQRTCIVPIQ